jgi:hypothetical protein
VGHCHAGNFPWEDLVRPGGRGVPQRDQAGFEAGVCGRVEAWGVDTQLGLAGHDPTLFGLDDVRGRRKHLDVGAARLVRGLSCTEASALSVTGESEAGEGSPHQGRGAAHRPPQGSRQCRLVCAQQVEDRVHLASTC